MVMNTPRENQHERPLPHFDVLVVGLGFAGCAVVVEAHRRGWSVGAVDLPEEGKPVASRVASGLVNPLVLKRRRTVGNAEAAWKSALELYGWLEQTTGESVLERTAVAEHLATPADDLDWIRLAEREGFHELLEPDTFSNPYAGLRFNRMGLVRSSGRLQPSRYLESVRSLLGPSVLEQKATQLKPGAQGWSVLDRTGKAMAAARKVILCEGPYASLTETFWGDLNWARVRGEGLDVEIPGLNLDRPVHARFFILPDRSAGADRYKVGATYVWDGIEEPRPTSAGQEELESWLQEVVALPYRVVGHWCGVRPARKNRQALCEWHPELPHLGVLNGLGSRGALTAPMLAAQLLDSSVEAVEDADR